MNLEEKKIREEYIYKGSIIKLRVDDAQVPDGTIHKREVVEHNGGVCVVPVTDNGEIITVKQFRYPYMEVVKEVPAGKRDGNEEPIVCGIRELKEETGCTAERFEYLGELYPSPGFCGEIIHMYAAFGLSYGDTDPDEDEFLLVEKTPIKELVEEILRGEIKDAKTQAAVLKTYYLLENQK